MVYLGEEETRWKVNYKYCKGQEYCQELGWKKIEFYEIFT